MFYTRTAYGSHQITTEETEVSLRILNFERLHQMGCMEVTRSLADNEIIFHQVLLRIRKLQILNQTHCATFPATDSW